MSLNRHCGRCKFVAGVDDAQLPVGWTHVVATPAHPLKPESRDLCPRCVSDLAYWLKSEVVRDKWGNLIEVGAA